MPAETLCHLPPDILGDCSRMDLAVAAHRLRCTVFPSPQLARVAAALDRMAQYVEAPAEALEPLAVRFGARVAAEPVTASGGLPGVGKRHVWESV